MGAFPILVVDDDLLRKLPERFQADPRFRKGASMELVPLRTHVPDWRELGGIGAESSADPNAVLEQERLRELADQARWHND